MNPIWALLFKDRIRTPFSVYKMSLAEITILIALAAGIGYGLYKAVDWVLNVSSVTEIV